jgi:hypothetical protein
MLKIIYILSFCLLLFGNVYSQTILYVKPSIENKIFIGNRSYGIFDPFITKNRPFNNPYIDIWNNKFFTAPVLNLGLSLGLSLKDKHFIELMFSNDAAGNRLDMEFLSLGGSSEFEKIYLQSRAYRLGGINYHRFGINYQYKISDNFKKSNFGISTGVGLLYNPNVKFPRGPYPIITEWGTYLDGTPDKLTPNLTFESIETNQYAVSRWGGFMLLGLYGDLYISKKYLFSMNIYYLQSLRLMEITTNKLVFEDNGVIKTFTYYSNSRGSGIYLQLSRRINLWNSKNTYIKNSNK